MRKDELIRALVKYSRRKPKRSHNGIAHTSPEAGAQSRASLERLRQFPGRLSEMRKIAASNGHAAARKAQDRLVVMVRDPYWLHAFWELAPQSVERAQSALGQHWHATRPVIRVFQVAADGSASLQREVPI